MRHRDKKYKFIAITVIILFYALPSFCQVTYHDYFSGKKCQKAGKIDSAINLYKGVLTLPVLPGTPQNAACLNLAEIYLNKKDITTAIHFLNLSVNPYYENNGCGNAIVESGARTRVLYAKCYIEKNDYEKAIEQLSPYMFGNELLDSTTQDDLVDLLFSCYKKVYTTNQIKATFLNLDDAIGVDIDRENGEINTLVHIFDNEIQTNEERVPFNEGDSIQTLYDELVKQCAELVKKSRIYKLAVAN